MGGAVMERNKEERLRQRAIHVGDANHRTVCNIRKVSDADFLADAMLLGPGGRIPEGTAVESLTWGRIKASFRR